MHYPLFLNLTNQPVVVVGGGTVARRKIRSLIAAGALVTVISPNAVGLPKTVRWLRRRYRNGDLRGARLVISATDDQAVNAQVCAEAKRRKLLVNCVAPPSAGNFIVPAVARRGGLTIAVSTGGVSPALAKRLRRDLERLLRKDYPQLRDD
jgi:precorrin-2 dehydrogenase